MKWGLNADPAAPGASAVSTFRPFSGRADVANFFTGLGRDLDFHTFPSQSFAARPREVVSLVIIDLTVRSPGRRVRVESLHHFTFDEAGLVAASMNSPTHSPSPPPGKK